MTIPDYETLMLPLLRIAAEGETGLRDVRVRLADAFDLSAEDRVQRQPSGRENLLASRVRWAANYMRKAGLLVNPKRGVFVASADGRKLLAALPEAIDCKLLSRYPSFADFKRQKGGVGKNERRPESHVAPVPRAPVYKVMVESLDPVLGYGRVRLGLEVVLTGGEGLEEDSVAPICLGLRVPGRDDVQVLVKEAVGAELLEGHVRLAANADPAEVLFSLVGSCKEQVQLEAFHPDAIPAVTSRLLNGWFDVAEALSPTGTPRCATRSELDWAMAIADERIRNVFLHIARYRSITETEVGRLLGSPRAARRFAASLDGHLSHLPFAVRVESTPQGKRYVKDRET